MCVHHVYKIMSNLLLCHAQGHHLICNTAQSAAPTAGMKEWKIPDILTSEMLNLTPSPIVSVQIKTHTTPNVL